MGGLLVLALGAAILFAFLWQRELALRKEAEDLAASLAQSEMQWETVRMYTGVERKEVELTVQEQALVAEKIWNYYYTEKTDTQEREPVYGGLVIWVEFTRNGITHTWTFTVYEIGHTARLEDGTEFYYENEPDRNLLSWLETFI